jgi:hypothetical protein
LKAAEEEALASVEDPEAALEAEAHEDLAEAAEEAVEAAAAAWEGPFNNRERALQPK